MNQCTINKQMSNNKHVPRLTTKLLMFARRKKETRIHEFFRVTRAACSPLRNSSRSSIGAIAGHIIDWHSHEEEPVSSSSSSSPGGPGIKKRQISSEISNNRAFQISLAFFFSHKYASRRILFFFFFFWSQHSDSRTERAVQAALQSGATAPTTFHLHQTWTDSPYTKLLCDSTTFYDKKMEIFAHLRNRQTTDLTEKKKENVDLNNGVFIYAFKEVWPCYKAPAAFLITRETLWTQGSAKPRAQHAGKQDRAANTKKKSYLQTNKFSFKGCVAIDKDTFPRDEAGRVWKPAAGSV